MKEETSDQSPTQGAVAEAGGPSKKECPVCAELISPNAKKCIHCDSFLDRRRYLQFSSTVLALLVALVSVITTAIPVVEKALRSEDSAVNLTYQAVQGDNPHLIVTNPGPKAGGIGAGRLQINGVTEKALEVPLAVVGYAAGETFIDAGKSRQIEMFPVGGLRKLTDAEVSRLPDATCTLVVQVVQYSGKTKDFVFERRCIEFRKLLERAQGHGQ